MTEDENVNPPIQEAPSFDELSQVRTNVTTDGNNLQEMVQNIQQKYSNMLQQLQAVKENDEVELSAEKEQFLNGTIEQVQALLQQVGGQQGGNL